MGLSLSCFITYLEIYDAVHVLLVVIGEVFAHLAGEELFPNSFLPGIPFLPREDEGGRVVPVPLRIEQMLGYCPKLPELAEPRLRIRTTRGAVTAALQLLRSSAAFRRRYTQPAATAMELPPPPAARA